MRPALLPRLFALALATAVALPALASLKPGAAAPDFTAAATLGGKGFTFSLAEALKKGPVVVYFYPAAFTSGCTAEAHAFAEAMEQFKTQGAQVLGLSGDDIDTLHKFSVSECGSKFPVAADPGLKISKAYDATMFLWPGHSDRTSYVVTPDGKILEAYSAMSPGKHVQMMLDALKAWRAGQPATAG